MEDTTPPHTSQPHTVTPSQSSQGHTVTNGEFLTPSRRSLTNTSIPRPPHITTSTQSTDEYNEDDLLTPSETTPTSSILYRPPRASAEEEGSYAKMASGTNTFLSPQPHARDNDEHPSNISTASQGQRSGKHRLYALSRAPPGGHVTVTSSDGSRVYLRMDKGQKSETEFSFLNSQLVSVPIAELRAAVEEEVRGGSVLSVLVCEGVG